MKPGRLLAYAITGIIAGLIIENGSLRIRQLAGKKTRELKKKISRKVQKALPE